MEKTANCKCKTEIMMKRGDRLYEFCPYCGRKLASTWQNVGQDDSNPVRICQRCDTSWIWRLYG